jgi:hypothetical protein
VSESTDIRETVGEGDSGPFSLRQPDVANTKTMKKTDNNTRGYFLDMLIVPRWRNAILCFPAEDRISFPPEVLAVAFQ